MAKHVTGSTQNIVKNYVDSVASGGAHRPPRKMQNVSEQRLNAPCLTVL